MGENLNKKITKKKGFKECIKILPFLSLALDEEKIYIFSDGSSKRIRNDDFYEINKTIWWKNINEELKEIIDWYNKWCSKYNEWDTLKHWEVVLSNYIMLNWKKCITQTKVNPKKIEEHRLHLYHILWRLIYSHPAMRFVNNDWFTVYDLLSDIFLVCDNILATQEFSDTNKNSRIFYVSHYRNSCQKIKKDYMEREKFTYWLNNFYLFKNYNELCQDW